MATKPSSLDEVNRFIASQSANDLPINFLKTDSINSYLCCVSWGMCVGALGFTLCVNPLALFCPSSVTKYMQLTLNQNEIEYHTAVNDCCCHVAESHKTVPLERVLEVELQEDCCQTCFSLKQVNVQTAAGTGMGAEVMAAFLAQPEQAREAIKLAAKLAQARAKAPDQEGGMDRGGKGRSGPGVLHGRLQRLDDLVTRGVVSSKERDGMRMAVLTAGDVDITLRLASAADLLEEGRVSKEEFEELRGRLVSQAMKGA